MKSIPTQAAWWILLAAGCTRLPEGDKTRCLTDLDCLGTYSCVEERCVPGDCWKDEHCGSGQQCVDSRCRGIATCASDADCADPTPLCDRDAGRCVACLPDCDGKCCGDDGCGGTCADACAGTGQACNPTSCECEGTCTPTCAGKQCGPDGCGASCGTCQGNTYCEQGICEPAGCQGDGDCAAPTPFCITASGLCVQCREAADCPQGSVCEAGLCVRPPCSSDAECDPGSICVDGDCTPGCRSGRDCPADQVCLTGVGPNGTCAQCQDDAGCGLDQRCAEYRCCDLRASTLCEEGVSYWVDGCGNLQEVQAVCEHGCNAARDGCETVFECQTNADCAANEYCDLVSHTCEEKTCTPQCAGKCCGNDGCGGTCPDTCGAGTTCEPGSCRCEGTPQWTVEVIDAVCDYPLHYLCYGGSFSAVLDDQDQLQVAYTSGVVYAANQGTQGELRFATPTQTGWRVQVVENLDTPKEQLPVYTGTRVTLARAQDGTLHLGYNDANGFRYAQNRGAGWQFVSGFDPEAYAMRQILVDSQGHPHVIYSYYVSYLDTGMRYARYNGTGWDPVDVRDLWGLYNSLSDFSLDPGDLPQVLLINGAGNMYHARLSGTVWNKTMVYANPYGSPVLATDAGGQPHLVFMPTEDGGMMYGRPAAVGFELEQVPFTGRVVGPALNLDPAGRAHLAFRDYNQKLLKYARRDASGWDIQTIDAQAYYGNEHQVLLDSAGRPIIVFSDDDYLKVATLVQ